MRKYEQNAKPPFVFTTLTGLLGILVAFLVSQVQYLLKILTGLKTAFTHSDLVFT